MINQRFRTVASAAALALPIACADAEPCTQPAIVADLDRFSDEASGIVAATDGQLWLHDDSGPPTLFLIDDAGQRLATVTVPATTNDDWEDIAAGPCADGRCLYIGAIGDNLHERDDRAILRMPEPGADDAATAAPARFPIAFPDGPSDAEALFILPDTTLYLITKGRDRPATLYRYPPPLRSSRVTLEPVMTLDDDIAQFPDMITGADVSPDGATLVVRSYTWLRFYDIRPDDDGPRFELRRTIPLTGAGEAQGEGVAVLADGRIALVGERGNAQSGRTHPGSTLALMTCDLGAR